MPKVPNDTKPSGVVLQSVLQTVLCYSYLGLQKTLATKQCAGGEAIAKRSSEDTINP